MRSFFVCTFSLLCCLASSAVASHAADLPPAGPREGVKPRNVVFILTDDHRYDAMGFMGHPFLKTPHLDSLASNGVHLKNAFVTTSLCSPQPGVDLDGAVHAQASRDRQQPAGSRRHDLLPAVPAAAGYSTAFIGKWHMGGASRRSTSRLRSLDQLPRARQLSAARPQVHAERQWPSA